MPAERQRVVTLLALLRRTTKLMVDELVERMEAAGQPTQRSFHYVFENIDPGGTRLTVLAARAGMTHQSMGEMVAAIEKQGYVERLPDPSDRRARLVRLTATGEDHVRLAVKELRAIESTWRARWRKAGLTDDLLPIFAAALAQDAGD